MPLKETQIREILKGPGRDAVIQKAIRHEERLRFHSEVAIERPGVSRQITDFLTWVQGHLPKEKYQTFLSLFRYPVKTVQETEKIYAALAKVFDGQNPVYRYDFINPTLNQDWQEYRDKVLQADDVWRTDGMETLRLAVNSVVVVDLPEVQTTERPAPYFYFLGIENVIKVESDGSSIDWIVFRQDPTTVIAIDDMAYWRFTHPLGRPDELTLERRSEHDLGYCPVTWFWHEPLTKNEPLVKKAPISTHLGDLDWLLYFMTAKQHLDLYAGYPIYSSVDPDCDYFHESDTGTEVCDRGFLRDENNHYIMLRTGEIARCPVCSRSSLVGPGSHIGVPKPSPENNNTEIRNPIQITTIDHRALAYNVSEIERLCTRLYEDITGYGGEPYNKQAVNETQIMSAFEYRTMVLRELKRGFEIIQEWVDSTICRLRYGDLFVDCSIDMGTDFYLYDTGQIMNMYIAARNSELEDQILDVLLDTYYQTKFRNDPDQLTRQEILKHLHPARHVTKVRAKELYESGMIGEDDLKLILYFSTFVLQFEREQSNLVEFGKGLPLDARINRIKQIIRSYGRKFDEPRPTEGDGAGDDEGAGNRAHVGAESTQAGE